MLYGLLCRDKKKDDTDEDDNANNNLQEHKGHSGWNDREKLTFAVRLATLKVQREGFGGLGAAAAATFASGISSKVPL
jgi:hypothetical protein